ncbi:hypothetical protein DZA28_07750 [Pseudomonas alloputida]|uniref:Uncharacterized protein n=1 Tax=Pseudomonas alloputida TaxID=1940621 RepID=A0ABY3D2R5_9PSED|nr:hypothetical protein DZA28_07750 [Pseudomonas alloputida]
MFRLVNNSPGAASSRVNPLLQRLAPNHRMCPPHDPCRSGFTREYGGGCDGESPGDTGRHRQ